MCPVIPEVPVLEVPIPVVPWTSQACCSLCFLSLIYGYPWASKISESSGLLLHQHNPGSRLLHRLCPAQLLPSHQLSQIRKSFFSRCLFALLLSSHGFEPLIYFVLYWNREDRDSNNKGDRTFAITGPAGSYCLCHQLILNILWKLFKSLPSYALWCFSLLYCVFLYSTFESPCLNVLYKWNKLETSD